MRRHNKSSAHIKPAMVSPVRALLRFAARLHQNDSGAISVLTLLTIWCLIALVALVWNTTEASMRRQHLQAAADSAAHSAAVWQTKAVNAVAAQNMVIAQDAAAQTIWEAVPICDKALNNKLNGSEPYFSSGANELRQIARLRAGIKQRQGRIQTLIAQINLNHTLLTQALANFSSNIGEANITDPKDLLTFTKQVRQAGSAIGWVDGTYLNGAPATNGRPGPPAPGNEGLIQYANDYVTKNIDTQILDLIENYINTVEFPVVQQFEAKTAPATSQPLDQRARDHEREVYASQSAIVAGVPDAVEQQRAKIAEFYKADITLATLQNDGTVSGPAAVTAPIKPADQLTSETTTDSIRARYPAEAEKEFGTSDPTVTIDPVNPQTNNLLSGDARVWHPNVVLDLPGLANPFTMNCNTNGGWGHVWAMPIERYYNDRTYRDRQNIDTDYMKVIDTLRDALLQQILQMMGGTDIAPLPGKIPDDQPNEKGVIEQIGVLPTLALPFKAKPTAKFQSQFDLYKLLAPQYISEIQSLWQMLRAQQYYPFYMHFASDAWNGSVDKARDDVIQELGTNKTFMVLSTYKLRYIPDGEIKESLRGSAQAAIWAEIVSNNNPRILSAFLRANKGARPSAASVALAIQAMETSAWDVASEIADEWVARPWPYEIEPPKDSDPSPRGLGKEDRQQYFTVIAAAKQADGSTPKYLLPKIFGTQPKLVTYAQAETFNWMEFNTNYGGSEHFDQVSWISYNRGFDGIPVPRCWRLSSVGGWSWQPRLSVADALPKALDLNQELQSYLSDAGFSGSSPSDIDTINLH